VLQSEYGNPFKPWGRVFPFRAGVITVLAEATRCTELRRTKTSWQADSGKIPKVGEGVAQVFKAILVAARPINQDKLPGLTESQLRLFESF